MTTDNKGAISRDAALLAKLARAIRDAHEERDFIRPSLSDASEIERIAALLAAQPAQAVGAKAVAWPLQKADGTLHWLGCETKPSEADKKYLMPGERYVGVGVISPHPEQGKALPDWTRRTVHDIAEKCGIFGEPLACLANILGDGNRDLLYRLTTPIAQMMVDAPEPIHASDAAKGKA